MSLFYWFFESYLSSYVDEVCWSIISESSTEFETTIFFLCTWLYTGIFQVTNPTKASLFVQLIKYSRVPQLPITLEQCNQLLALLKQNHPEEVLFDNVTFTNPDHLFADMAGNSPLLHTSYLVFFLIWKYRWSFLDYRYRCHWPYGVLHYSSHFYYLNRV